MKRNEAAANHNFWYTCQYCGEEFDQRIHMERCPHCGADVSFNAFIFRKAVKFSVMFLVILMVVALLFTSCTSTKYAVRRHHNHIAQKVIQYEHCRPDRYRDWKICQHFNERPKSHWPFNFLQ